MNKKHFTSTGIILKDNRILTIWHEKLQAWLPPGGHIEKNETPEEALIRECYEEINAEVIIINNSNDDISTFDVNVLNNPYCVLLEPIKSKTEIHYHIDFFYICKLKDQTLDFSKNKNLQWVSLENIDTLDTFENVKKLFKTILKEWN